MGSNHYIVKKALLDDIIAVSNLYDAVNDYFETTAGFIPFGWKKGEYPNINTVRNAVEKGNLYILSREHKIVGACVIDHEQHPAYAQLPWTVKAEPEQVLAIHDLVSDPKKRRKGIGKQMVNYIIDYGHANKAKTIRLDTHYANVPARRLYETCGFNEIIVWTGIVSGVKQKFSVFEYIL